METIEIWKPIIIDNEETNYQVSNFGNVKNNKKILKPNNIAGYLNLTLTHNEKRFQKKIHRLLAIAFIPNPENKETVNHIDHNPVNNNIDNLEWATTIEQNRHKRKCKKEIKGTPRKIWKINKDTNEKIKLFSNISNATKWAFEHNLTKNINSCDISAVARGKQKTAFGYIWEYDNSNENIFENEIWKNIPKEIVDNFENNYKISNYGRLKNRNNRISNGNINPSGYSWVNIKTKQYLLHRLVAKIFIENPDNKKIINHKDGNKSNNNIQNLEWVSQSENVKHAYKNNLIDKRIIQYDLLGNKLNVFNSATEASQILNLSNTSISSCCSGYRNTTYVGNYIFRYYNDKDKIILPQKKRTHNKKIIQYDLQMNKINEYNSIKEASQKLNITKSSISRVCNNKQKTTGGFILKFVK